MRRFANRKEDSPSLLHSSHERGGSPKGSGRNGQTAGLKITRHFLCADHVHISSKQRLPSGYFMLYLAHSKTRILKTFPRRIHAQGIRKNCRRGLARGCSGRVFNCSKGTTGSSG